MGCFDCLRVIQFIIFIAMLYGCGEIDVNGRKQVNEGVKNNESSYNIYYENKDYAQISIDWVDSSGELLLRQSKILIKIDKRLDWDQIWGSLIEKQLDQGRYEEDDFIVSDSHVENLIAVKLPDDMLTFYFKQKKTEPLNFTKIVAGCVLISDEQNTNCAISKKIYGSWVKIKFNHGFLADSDAIFEKVDEIVRDFISRDS